MARNALVAIALMVGVASSGFAAAPRGRPVARAKPAAATAVSPIWGPLARLAGTAWQNDSGEVMRWSWKQRGEVMAFDYARAGVSGTDEFRLSFDAKSIVLAAGGSGALSPVSFPGPASFQIDDTAGNFVIGCRILAKGDAQACEVNRGGTRVAMQRRKISDADFTSRQTALTAMAPAVAQRTSRPTVGLTFDRSGKPAVAHGMFTSVSVAGAVVTDVSPQSPAATAGIRKGDVVTELNGRKGMTAQEADELIGKSPVGTPFRLAVVRGGMSRRYVSVTSVEEAGGGAAAAMSPGAPRKAFIASNSGGAGRVAASAAPALSPPQQGERVVHKEQPITAETDANDQGDSLIWKVPFYRIDAAPGEMLRATVSAYGERMIVEASPWSEPRRRYVEMEDNGGSRKDPSIVFRQGDKPLFLKVWTRGKSKKYTILLHKLEPWEIKKIEFEAQLRRQSEAQAASERSSGMETFMKGALGAAQTYVDVRNGGSMPTTGGMENPIDPNSAQNRAFQSNLQQLVQRGQAERAANERAAAERAAAAQRAAPSSTLARSSNPGVSAPTPPARSLQSAPPPAKPAQPSRPSLAQQQAAAESQRRKEAAEQEKAAASALANWDEGITLCAAPHIGKGADWTCHGPLQTTWGAVGQQSGKIAISQACGTDYNNVRDLGTASGYRVFGCGFGISPLPSMRDYPGQGDPPARLRVFVPGRATYSCPRNQTNVCKRRN